VLVVEELIKYYGKFKAVDNISFTIEEGNIFGFVGENGAGKTTTMRIISGLLAPTSGRVYLDNIDVNKSPMKVKEGIGYMPDFFGVYDDLKVIEYMDFYAGVYGIAKSKRKKTINELIEIVNLDNKKEFYVNDLSRGMKQRLCLARSLIHDPKLLILDEPASGLDPKARIEMKQILFELKKMGKTILISSHILPELSEICSSVGIIEHGKMIVSGKIEDVLNQIGKHNIIKVKTLNGIEKLSKLLKEIPEISNINQKENILEFNFDNDDEKLSELLKRIVNQDIKVISFSSFEKNLESVFLHLMGGKKNDKSNN
jgi:ABC-2 type transport system ATP-binding protein